MATFALPFGEETVQVGDGGFLLEPLGRERQSLPSADPIETALAAPLGTPRLERLVRPGDRVLIVVSDGTRSTAADRTVPALLRRLSGAGIPDSDVRYIVACGLHPQPDDREAAAIVGAEVARRLQRVCSTPVDGADFVDMGATRRGTPIRVHRALVEHSRVILTGAVSFHYYAGFTGGRKSILPGLAAPESIAANHLLALGPEGRHPAAIAGRLDGNPVHMDMAEACARIDPAFLINVITGPGGVVEAAFAGHWDRAHRHACRELRAARIVRVPEARDLVLLSAGGHPRDIDLLQAHKAIEAAFPVVRRGGAMIVLAACPRGIGHPRLDAWLDGRAAPALALDLRRSYEVYGQTAHALRSKTEAVTTWFVSGLPDAAVRRAGMRPAADAAQALREAAAHLGGGARGWLIPRAVDQRFEVDGAEIVWPSA